MSDTAAKGWPDDIYELIDNLNSAFRAAKKIEEVEAAWDHFHRVETYVEIGWPNDRALLDRCRRLKSGLSVYTRDVRDRMPSPYTGWAVDLECLRRDVGPKYDKDGWPK